MYIVFRTCLKTNAIVSYCMFKKLPFYINRFHVECCERSHGLASTIRQRWPQPSVQVLHFLHSDDEVGRNLTDKLSHQHVQRDVQQ